VAFFNCSSFYFFRLVIALVSFAVLATFLATATGFIEEAAVDTVITDTVSYSGFSYETFLGGAFEVISIIESLDID